MLSLEHYYDTSGDKSGGALLRGFPVHIVEMLQLFESFLRRIKTSLKPVCQEEQLFMQDYSFCSKKNSFLKILFYESDAS